MDKEEKKTETVKIRSSRFGELEVPVTSIFTIVNGIIGFPNFNKYTLLEYNPPFSWLHSVENPELAFVVVNAAEFGEEYRVPLPVGDRDIELRENDDVAAVNLVCVRSDPTQTTVNMKAPVVVNLRTMLGRQIVIDDPRYPVRMPLWAKKEAEEKK